MQFVPPKSPEQQDIQALHRARQRIVNHRTATVCQIRGLLLDRGIPLAVLSPELAVLFLLSLKMQKTV
ncbi:hypothetical protein LFZ36_06840 [Salmonella enterica subsp. enterica serovar Ouakam str. SA20034636]|nr:hypothetical protein LFZ36_06840 [Salmonella enterica subsp. enterica serovar Ouakam str. SA20034636]